MIFEEVVLHNFGVYQGRHAVSLEVSPARPIVLIGAMNGSGKTTFLDAMQLALYGKSARCTGRERVSYHEYLESMINRDAPASQGAGVEFAFRTRTDGNDTRIRIVRTWSLRGQVVRENLEVSRDDVVDSVASERWQEFVEDLMPSQIADLFFFDGEKIEALADPIRSAALLRVGVHSLLGIDLVESLVKSLQQIERKRKSICATATERSALESLHKQAAETVDRRGAMHQQISAYRIEADTAEQSLAFSSAEFKRLGGDLFNRREQLQAERASLTSRKVEIESRLRDTAAGILPVSLPSSLVRLAVDKAKRGRSMKDVAALLAEAVRRDEALLTFLREIPTSDEILADVASYMSADRLQRYSHKNSELLLPEGILEQHRSEELERDRKGALFLLKEVADVKEKLAAVERHLSAVPEEAVIAESQLRVDGFRRDLARIEAQITMAEKELSDLDGKLTRLQQLIDRENSRLGELQLGNEVSQRLIEHSTRARETLAKFRDQLLQKNLARLQTSINECLQDLLRKRSLVNSVVISADSFQISVMNPNGNIIPAHRLSAGERQLLAVATLWALSRASGRHLPAVIDTPLSRLDSQHRKTIVRNYFPAASHQVILLSTDEEVVGTYYQMLRQYVGREYIIDHDESGHTSRFREGYFSLPSELEDKAA